MKFDYIGRNQMTLHLSDGSFMLLSYSTPVAVCTDTHFYVTEEKHSKTTTKHINNWWAFPSDRSRIREKPQEWFDNYLTNREECRGYYQ